MRLVTQLLVFFLSSISIALHARTDSSKEYNNSIIFHGSDHYYHLSDFRKFGLLYIPSDDQIGFCYQRKIFKNFSVKIGYNQFNDIKKLRPVRGPFFVGPSDDNLPPGAIETSGKFKMGDLFFEYGTFLSKRQKLTAGLGLSYTCGEWEKVDSISVFPGYLDSLMFSHPENVKFWGIVPELSYDFLILTRRLSVGADIRYRKYFGYYFHRLEYGVHLGLNF